LKTNLFQWQEKVLGVMCLNTDINYKKLAEIYDLSPYYGLMKPTPMEKEIAKRTNILLKTFG
jgi:hypothetical protein